MTLLGFPGNILPIRGEMFIDGAWVDITSRVRGEGQIEIRGRGRVNEQQNQPTPVTCDFMLNNRDGYFSNRLPTSTNYGKIPRYLPVRFGVTEDRSFLTLDDSDTARLKTTDKAVLDITGDIDIRCEFQPDNREQGLRGFILASKYRRTASANRSWCFAITSLGYPTLIWTTDGTVNTFLQITATTPLTNPFGAQAVRVTFDVNNGAAGRTATFYTSDSVTGTWTQLGAAVIQAGTTSIFSGTAEIELGRIDDGVQGAITGLWGLTGRIYGFELYSGIGGTLVAEADIYNQARATTSFSDGLSTPNTWTVEGTAAITPDDYRFTGELSSLPVKWDRSGRDVWIPVRAADIRQRLSKGGVPVDSSLKKYFLGLTSTGFWPAEDGSAATSMANFSTNGGPVGQVTDVTFSRPSDFPASAGSVTLNSTASRIGLVAKVTAVNGFACFNWSMKMASVPASAVTLLNISADGGGGEVRRINFSVSATAFDLAVYDGANALLTNNSTGFGATISPDEWITYRIQMQQSGGNIQVDLGWYKSGEGILYGAGALTTAGTSGRFTGVQMVGNANNVGTQYTQLFMGQFFLDNTGYEYALAASAFASETTTQRFTRIGGENGITTRIVGNADDAEPMGPQPIDTPINIMHQAVTTENGVVYPARDSLTLIMRTRRSLINQWGPQIDYSLAELGESVPEPVDDDGTLRNAVTAIRLSDGSQAFAFQDQGPNSTTPVTDDPPGVGTVPGSINRETFTAERLLDQAEYDVFIGTWDELRWPFVEINRARQNYAGTFAKVQKGGILSHLDVGDMFILANPPSEFLLFDDVEWILQGTSQETLGQKIWRIRWNTTPYGPYRMNDLTLESNSRYRAAAGTNSTVSANFDSDDTSFTVAVATGSKLWGTTTTKPGNFPQNVIVGGEVITISGISGTTSPQTFTVSARSVNGVVKSHVVGDAVEVQQPFYLGL